MKTTIKTIELTRRIREKQYDEIKGKDHNQIVDYFKKRAHEINKVKNILVSK